MKRLQVGEERLNALVGTVALVVMALMALCLAVPAFFAFVGRFVFVDPFVVVVYGGLPLGVALGWFAVYRLWKQYFYRKPIANARQIIRLLGSLLFVSLVGFSTYLLFLMVSYVVTR